MQSADVPIENGTPTDREEEKLQWLPIDELQNIHLVPEFLRTALKAIPTEVSHIITVE